MAEHILVRQAAFRSRHLPNRNGRRSGGSRNLRSGEKSAAYFGPGGATSYRAQPLGFFTDVKTIELTKGYAALVDDQDYEWLNSFSWQASIIKGKVYASRGIRIGKKMRTEFMHRVLLDAPAGVEVDHKDGNSLHNFRTNLRFATRSQQTQNSFSGRNTSGVRGVWFHRPSGKWVAQLKAPGYKTHIGIFTDIKKAKAARDARAKEAFGEFAKCSI